MANPTKKQFYDFALERMKQEHADLLDVWKQMDSKAQATASIAGGFLAAAFAFVRGSIVSGSFETTLLSVAVILLVVTIGFSLACMRVRVTYSPLTGVRTVKMTRQIFKQPASAGGDLYLRMLDETLDAWSEVNEQLREGAESKSSNLRRAQWSLLLSAAAVLVLTVTAIVEPPTTSVGAKNGQVHH